MNIFLQPVITEKSMGLSGDGKYTFLVSTSATKKAIKTAVSKKFNVHVTSVITVITKGRSIRTGAKRTKVVKSPIKKAVVEVKKGEKIALFEEVK